jgi:putative transposase
VGDDRYLLQCHRYIELNPLRAKMVADPADYAWSSHRCHALGIPDPLITPHPAMARLGSTGEERRRNYRELVMQADARMPQSLLQGLRPCPGPPGSTFPALHNT